MVSSQISGPVDARWAAGLAGLLNWPGMKEPGISFASSAQQLIGHTPLLELTNIEKAEGLQARILAKLEYFNPAGSAKDPAY